MSDREMPHMAQRSWRKSSYSGQDGNCVEVARNLPGLVAVRDSEKPDGVILEFGDAIGHQIAGVRKTPRQKFFDGALRGQARETDVTLLGQE